MPRGFWSLSGTDVCLSSKGEPYAVKYCKEVKENGDLCMAYHAGEDQCAA
jgi:hypothetical protein